MQKPAQIVKITTLKRQVKDEDFKDTDVMIAIRNFNQKEDQINYKKSSSINIFIRDKR